MNLKTMEDQELEFEARKGHRQAAFAVAKYFARAFQKVPMMGTAKFGDFRVEILIRGVSIKDNGDLIGFVPSGK